MNPDWFADRLKELREGAGLSQQALADKSGMTREGIAQLETRRRKPSWESVVALCQALDVGCDAFTTPAAERQDQGRGRPRKAPAAVSAVSGTAEQADPSTAAPKTSTGQKKGKRKGGK